MTPFPYPTRKVLEVCFETRNHAVARGGWQRPEQRTLGDGVFDAALLGALLAAALTLFAELGEDKRSYAVDHAREDRIAGVEEPRLRKGWIVEVDAAFEYGVFCDSEVSPEGRHGWRDVAGQQSNVE